MRFSVGGALRAARSWRRIGISGCECLVKVGFLKQVKPMNRSENLSPRQGEPTSDAAGGPAMPEVLDLENSILVLLTMLSNMIGSTGLATFRARHGLGSTEWKVLSVVAARPRSSGAQIAQFLSIDRGLVSRTLQSLARKGLVRVERSGKQSNYQAISLTPQGMDIHRQALITALEREKLILAGIDVAERDAMIGGLKKMLTNMKAVAGLSEKASPQITDMQGLEHLR
jgi:DNA-binding MarR family transcriptional regulator